MKQINTYRIYFHLKTASLRLNLPIESCLLQFVIKNKKLTEEEKAKEREMAEEQNEDEELDDLEDDYAYYYGEDDDDSSGSDEATNGFETISSISDRVFKISYPGYMASEIKVFCFELFFLNFFVLNFFLNFFILNFFILNFFFDFCFRTFLELLFFELFFAFFLLFPDMSSEIKVFFFIFSIFYRFSRFYNFSRFYHFFNILWLNFFIIFQHRWTAFLNILSFKKCYHFLTFYDFSTFYHFSTFYNFSTLWGSGKNNDLTFKKKKSKQISTITIFM